MEKDEFSLINSISPKKYHQSSLIYGIGDDTAIIAENIEKEELICVDTLVEGVHFLEETMTWKQVGYKSLGVNISDIAAMGGIPAYYLVSIAIPAHYQAEQIQEIYRGMEQVAKEYEMDLIGGDTVLTKGPLVITVTVIGYVERGRYLLRKNAQPGDVVFVTNTIGNASCGLDLLLHYGKDYAYTEEEKEMIHFHQMPVPQIRAGRILAQSAVRIALNDVSDGLASELHELAEASDVTIIVDAERVPYHPYMLNVTTKQREEWAFFGGEDFQLVGSVAQQDWDMLKTTFEQARIPVHIIGEVVEKQNNHVLVKRKTSIERLDKKGYNHFSK